MKKPIIVLAILTIMLLQASNIFAQNALTAGALEMKQSVIANGGGAQSGGVFSLESTIGQPLAGNLSQNGSFSLLSGFQAGIPVSQTGWLTINGQVTNGGNALPGVTIVLSGGTSMSTVTNVTGNYSFTGLVPGTNYTVTPFFSNHAFNPPSSTFNNLSGNQTANFVASQCSFAINPNGTNAPAAGASGSITLTTANAGCTWTVVSNDNWISIAGATNGVNSGAISFVVAANDGDQRTGTITIAGQNFTITQSGNNFIVSGVINYATTPANQATKVVPSVNLFTTGSAQMSASSDNSGFYQFSGLTQGGNYTVSPVKNGNVNGITAFDATLVLRCVAAASNCTLTPNQRAAADSNNDSDVSAFDATQILRFVAANAANANTGQVGNWKFSPAPRTYNSVSNSFPAQDYQAILVGEINGDWTPPNGQPSSLAATDESEHESEKLAESSTVSESDTSALETEKTVDENQTETHGKAEAMEISIPDDPAAARESTVSIPVRLANQSGKQISAYRFAVRFDPNVLQPEADIAETAETLSRGFTIVSDTKTKGRIGIAASNPNAAITDSGTLLYLRFKVVGAARQSTTVRFQTGASDKAAFEDKDGIDVAARPKNGKVTVSADSTRAFVSVAGRVRTSDGRGIRNVLVSLTDEQGNTKTVLTGESGYYRFADVQPAATYTIAVSAKKFSFDQRSQTRLIGAETDSVNFTANPEP